MKSVKQVYKPKILKFSHECEVCGLIYLSADIKGRFCIECKKPRECKCGCGSIVRSPGRFLARGCSSRGKTYKEIYGTDDIKSGFKKGKLNPNYDPIIKAKANASLKSYYKENPHIKIIKSERQKLHILTRKKDCFKSRYKNNRGESFRSQLEHSFAELLYSNNIPYQREYPIKMVDGRIKVVDFVVSDILIEISGFAYKSWRLDFIDKIKTLRKSTFKPILILTYKNNLDDDKILSLLYECCSEDVFLCNVENKTKVIQSINFIQRLKKT